MSALPAALDLTPVPAAFFGRDADVVARDLIGHLLVHRTPLGLRVGRIVETEAYFGPPGANPLAARDDMPKGLRRALVAKGDPASHSFRGPTARNRVMFGPPGIAYVYLIYGMHECLNVSTGRDGQPQAVLLRAAQPLIGLDGERTDGPGRLTRAMGVTRAANGAPLTEPPLHFAHGSRPSRVAVSVRVNVVGGEAHKLRYTDPAPPRVPGARPRAGGVEHAPAESGKRRSGTTSSSTRRRMSKRPS